MRHQNDDCQLTMEYSPEFRDLPALRTNPLTSGIRNQLRDSPRPAAGMADGGDRGSGCLARARAAEDGPRGGVAGLGLTPPPRLDPFNVGLSPRRRRLRNRSQFDDWPAIERDHHELAFQRSIDQLPKFASGFGDIVGAHGTSITQTRGVSRAGPSRRAREATLRGRALCLRRERGVRGEGTRVRQSQLNRYGPA